MFGEMINAIDGIDSNGQPVGFSLRFVTADRKRKTGGDIIFIENGKKCVGKGKDGNVIWAAPVGESSTGVKKNPHHYANSTRNVLITSSGQIRKVHIRLIIEFNGKKVIP